MRKRMRALLWLIVAVVIATCSAYALLTAKSASADNSIDLSSGTVPAEFHKLRIGMGMTDVRATVGKAPVETRNPHFEAKSDVEWAQIKKQYDAKRQGQIDGDAVPDASFIKLGNELEHQFKDVWVYYPPPVSRKTWVSLRFDGRERLISAVSGPMTTAPKH